MVLPYIGALHYNQLTECPQFTIDPASAVEIQSTAHRMIVLASKSSISCPRRRRILLAPLLSDYCFSKWAYVHLSQLYHYSSKIKLIVMQIEPKCVIFPPICEVSNVDRQLIQP